MLVLKASHVRQEKLSAVTTASTKKRYPETGLSNER